MRIFVTGAGGFVGGAVARAAAAEGHEVVGTVRAASAMQASLPFLVIDLDLHDRNAVEEAVGAVRPEAIVAAAWSNVANHASSTPSRSLADVAGVVSLIEAGARNGLKRFLGLGSQAEYGPIEGATDETRLPQPTSLYGAAKIAAHHLARQFCAERSISFAWARLFSAFGPGDRPAWLIPHAIAELCAGRAPRTTSGRQRWDYLYIDDVATALLALCETACAEGVFNLGSGHATSVRSIVESIRDIAAPGLELAFGSVEHRPDQIWHMEANIAKLRAATGWTPTIDLEDGLARTIAAHRRRHCP